MTADAPQDGNDQEDQSDEPGLPCPRCEASEMTLVEDKGCTFYGCSDCRGLFVNEESLPYYIEEAKDATTAAAFQSLWLQLLGTDGRPSVRRCPSCGDPLKRFAFGQEPVVAIDRCELHGVWLDHKELKKIIKASLFASKQ